MDVRMIGMQDNNDRGDRGGGDARGQGLLIVVLLVAVVALLLAVVSLVSIKHLPTHAYLNARVDNLEVWAKAMCTTSNKDTACLELQQLDKDQFDRIFKVP